MMKKWIPAEIIQIKPYTTEDEKIVDQIVVVKLTDGNILWLFDAQCKVDLNLLRRCVLLSVEILIYKINKMKNCCSFSIKHVKGWSAEVCGKYLELSDGYGIDTLYGTIITYQKYKEYIGKDIIAYGRLDVNDVKRTERG